MIHICGPSLFTLSRHELKTIEVIFFQLQMIDQPYFGMNRCPISSIFTQR